jgi:D-aspartate ligase
MTFTTEQRTAASAAPEQAGPPSAIVIGLDNMTGLQTARILSRRGIRVVGIAADGRHPACRTRTCHRLVVAPTAGDDLLDTLDRLRASELGAVLFPCTDASVRTLAHGTHRLRGFRTSLPDADVVDQLMDKLRFAELVSDHQLPAPVTRLVTDLDQARRAAEELRFPCVVKPAIKTPRWEEAGPKVRRFSDARGWLASAAQLLGLHPELVIQEWLPGADDCLYSCNVYVAADGTPLVSFVARKLRQWPPHLGTSSLGEAVDDETIRDLALQVVSTVPFVGLGYVEIKRDPTTGQDHVIEVNVGRPTGRSAIAEGGGVELLETMYRDLVDQPLPVARRQQDRPIKWMHVVRDTASAMHYLRSGELTPLGWVRSVRGAKVYADLDLDDPGPFLADLRRLARVAAHRVGARGRRTPGARPALRPADGVGPAAGGTTW